MTVVTQFLPLLMLHLAAFYPSCNLEQKKLRTAEKTVKPSLSQYIDTDLCSIYFPTGSQLFLKWFWSA